MADGVVAELAAQARAAGRLGIDTEFMGEGRYRALLCLVQIAVETDDGVARRGPRPADRGVRPRAAGRPARRPRRPDRPARRRARTSRCCAASGRTELHDIFDTQVAAGFAGLRAQLGYEALLHEMLGVRLRKSASFTRWDTRPLSDEQVGYAREDVLHLLQLADALQATLRDRGRLDWAREECRSLEDASDEREPETIFDRLPRVNSLEPSPARGRLRARRAGARRPRASTDRPVPSVLADAALVEIAKRRPRIARAPAPRSAASTRARCAAAGARSSRRSSAGASASRSRSTATARRRPTPRTPRSSRSARRSCAPARRRPSSPTSCIAARADLQRIVTAVRTSGDEPEVRTLQGWRREVVGAELLELLQGRRSLRVGPGRTIEVTG